MGKSPHLASYACSSVYLFHEEPLTFAISAHYTKSSAAGCNKKHTGFVLGTPRHTMPQQGLNRSNERVDKVAPLCYFDSTIGHEEQGEGSAWGEFLTLSGTGR
jgi:hypothetical protein